MARTTKSDVKDIIELDTLTDSEIQAFIDDASQIIDNRLKGHTTDANLKLVEKWLAAHLCSMKEKRTSRERVGPITEEYEGGEFGQGLESTRYGQMCISLDPTGRLQVVRRHTETVNTVPSDVTGFEDNYKAGQ